MKFMLASSVGPRVKVFDSSTGLTRFPVVASKHKRRERVG